MGVIEQKEPSLSVTTQSPKDSVDDNMSSALKKCTENGRILVQDDSMVEQNAKDENDDDVSKIRWKVEYRVEEEDTLLYSEDITDATGYKRRPENTKGQPMFEVIEVNYTSETKDTQKDEKLKAKKPSVSCKGYQFIRIHSPALINALQCVVTYYPYESIIGNTVDIREPYAMIVHYKEELEALREWFGSNHTDDSASDCIVQDTYEHLGYLLDFVETKMGSKVREELERWKRPVPVATFDMLWMLLKPGIDVYVDEDWLGSREPWVMSYVGFEVKNESWSQYNVGYWHLIGVNDLFIKPSETVRVISRFHGEKPIDELEIFPCEYLKEHATRKAMLIERGQLYFSLQRQQCMYFDGECRTTPRRKYKGYVMIDPYEAYTNQKQWIESNLVGNLSAEAVDRKPAGIPIGNCNKCASLESEITKPAKFAGYANIESGKVKGLTEHQYFICNRSVLSFVFAIREWRDLLLEGFSKPKYDMKLIDNLVLKPQLKSMIQNLANIHINKMNADGNTHSDKKDGKSPTSASAWTADFIENKGTGLVFLLHGKPGVGKTYTAECVAESVHRPLLSITCADIGIDPQSVELTLIKWFKVAKRWGAILLLDEADIYMEYRQIHDLNRNNMVASFLRALEFYEGILFLTTNRIGTFDEAFLSRINLSIYYPDFTDEQREKIWNNYFDKIEKEAGDDIHVPYSTKEYAIESTAVRELKWNGREIRNAFQIAVNLAQAEGEKNDKGKILVKRDHIKVTVEMSKDFKDYMISLHRKTESERAKIMGYRNDVFGNDQTAGRNFI